MDTESRGPGVALTLTEAASACRLHRSTIRRHLFKQRFPNAYKESINGWWRIPVADLEAAGLRPNRMHPPDDAHPAGRVSLGGDLERLRAELVEAQRRAAEAHMRAAAAETLAQERLERIGDLRMAFRALQAGAQPPQEPPDDTLEGPMAGAEEEGERPGPIRRQPGTYQRIPVKDITATESKEPDLVSLAIDAYKVFTPWRRRRQ